MQVVPSRLFFTTSPSGQVEFSCFVTGVDSGTCAWSISSGDQVLTMEQPVPEGSGSGPLVLTAVLPAGWLDGVLRVEVDGYRAELSVTHPVRTTERFGLPLAGQQLVVGGHSIGEPHRMATALPSQQFAWDFVGLSQDRLAVLRGEPAAGLSVADFASFGAPVLAPAPGVVVTAMDGLPDTDMAIGPAPLDGDVTRAAGNHVVINHGAGVFSCLAHLKRSSVRVEEGQVVHRADPVGELGSSGNAFGPHVHLHFMDGPDLVTSNPLPVELDAEGTRFDPQAGQIIGP